MKIFISYSSQDRAIVQNIARDLDELGHETWFDQELTGGTHWWSAIITAIQDCDVFVFALTEAGLRSQPCRLEYTYAEALGKPILPVLLSRVDLDGLPRALSQIQFVDYQARDRSAVLALNKALRTLPPSPPLPAPLPPPPTVPLSPMYRLSEQADAPSLSYEQQATFLLGIENLAKQDVNRERLRQVVQRFLQRSDLEELPRHKANELYVQLEKGGRRTTSHGQQRSMLLGLGSLLLVGTLIVIGTAFILISNQQTKGTPLPTAAKLAIHTNVATTSGTLPATAISQLPTETSTPTARATDTAAPSATTVPPSASATDVPSSTPTLTFTPTPSATPTATSTDTPDATLTAAPLQTATAQVLQSIQAAQDASATAAQQAGLMTATALKEAQATLFAFGTSSVETRTAIEEQHQSETAMARQQQEFDATQTAIAFRQRALEATQTAQVLSNVNATSNAIAQQQTQIAVQQEQAYYATQTAVAYFTPFAVDPTWLQPSRFGASSYTLYPIAISAGAATWGARNFPELRLAWNGGNVEAIVRVSIPQAQPDTVGARTAGLIFENANDVISLSWSINNPRTTQVVLGGASQDVFGSRSMNYSNGWSGAQEGCYGMSVYLRLTKQGNGISAACSNDGTNWLPVHQQGGIAPAALGNNIIISLFAYSTDEYPIYAEFSEFTLRRF